MYFPQFLLNRLFIENHRNFMLDNRSVIGFKIIVIPSKDIILFFSNRIKDDFSSDVRPIPKLMFCCFMSFPIFIYSYLRVELWTFELVDHLNLSFRSYRSSNLNIDFRIVLLLFSCSSCLSCWFSSII